MSYGMDIPRMQQYGETTLINGYERYILDLPDIQVSGFLMPANW